MSDHEKTTSQLSTVNSAGQRLWLYPADVQGRYRTRRTWVSGVLLVFFLILPWIRIDGHQAVLVDVWNGRFSFFGLRFWSHDAPMLLFLVAGAAVLLAFVTSIWGRFWCGWACPQTVFVDMVFRRVERWIEGDAFRRRQLDQAPWSEVKVFKKSFKWLAYLLISLLLSHSFLAYFIGTEALAMMMRQAPSNNVGSFFAMALMTGAVLFDFGWLREQFCTLLCPYGRFQSVLMDENSLAVVYDAARGEPRRVPGAVGQKTGDCINCRKCVQVCPTGIDIRDGLQLECVACTACIDACDAVMTKIGKPKGLIRYQSGRSSGLTSFARPAAYLGVLLVLAGTLFWILWHREPVEVTLIRKVGTPYEEVIRPGLKNEVINFFKVDLLNQSFERVTFSLVLNPQFEGNGVYVVSPSLPLDLDPGETRRVDLFVRFPSSILQDGKRKLKIETMTQSSKLASPFLIQKEVPLVGPLR